MVEFQIHSTTKRAIAAVLIAAGVGSAIVASRGLLAPIASKSQDNLTSVIASDNAAFIAPIATLLIEDAKYESAWSAALASLLSARTEVPVANGRVDVLSDWYAIEVDRLDKWHEGIGQALHYGMATGKIPCLALMVDSDNWPLNASTISKLRTIEQTAVSKGVKLLLLRRRVDHLKPS